MYDAFVTCWGKGERALIAVIPVGDEAATLRLYDGRISKQDDNSHNNKNQMRKNMSLRA